MCAISAVAAVMLPLVGPSLDFGQGAHVAGHISDRSLTPLPVIQNAAGAWPLLLGYLAAFGCACAAYVAVLRAGALDARLIWGAFVLGCAAALSIGFLPTSDPYAYALYALEAGPLRLDPYVSQSLAGTTLPWAAQLLAILPDPEAYVRHCNYGPVAAFAYGALALPLAHAPLVAYLYAERIFGALCVAATGYLLARGAPAGEGTKRLAAYVLHPLVLTEFVAFAHGDALMLALLALAFASWRRDAFATAAACCVAATATRSVAVLALAALLLAALRLRPAALARALAGTLVAAVAIGGASLALYGEISLGGPPAFNRFAAPLSFVVTVLAGAVPVAPLLVAQAACGGALAIAIVRGWWLRLDSSLAWLPFAALAGLPAVYPHYLGWVAGVAALRPGRRFETVAAVATFVAPVWYVARMNLVAPPQPSPLAYGAALALCWGSVVVAATLSLRGRPGRASRAPAPAGADPRA
jgi:hypothetical protein